MPAVAKLNQTGQSGVRVAQTLSVGRVIIILAGQLALAMRITAQKTQIAN